MRKIDRMAKISQSTVVSMINVFEHLGCYDSMTYSYSGDGPLISATELRKFLYSLDFDNKLLDRFAEWDWAFKDITALLTRRYFLEYRRRASELAALPEWERGRERSRVERYMRSTGSNRTAVVRDESHYTFGSTCIVSGWPGRSR